AEAALHLFVDTAANIVNLDLTRDDLDDEDVGYLTAIKERLEELPDTIKKLNHMIDSQLLGSQSHANELFGQAHNHELTLDEFFEALNTPMTAVEGSTLGFHHALSQIQFSNQELKQIVLRNMQQIRWTTKLWNPSQQSTRELGLLAYIQDILGPLATRDTSWWLKGIGQKVHALAFVTHFNQPEGKGAKLKKQHIVEILFLGDDKAEMSEETKKSEKFKKFKKEVRENVKGSNRLLAAYKGFGAIVVFHPALKYRQFWNSHVGSDALKCLELIAPKRHTDDYLDQAESGRRALLWATLTALCDDLSVLKNKLRKVLHGAGSVEVQDV
ncbi:hypothetical protein FRC07_013391, partial [Ceratobasidium sp. 392]